MFNRDLAGFAVRIIEDSAGFAALEPGWTALDARAEVRPFQQFGWVAAWIRTLGAAGAWRLQIATLWQNERLVAVMPLCVRRYKGVRLLEWIGARVSDYCDVLVDPSIDSHTAFRTLWGEIDRRGGFDVARFSHVREDALAAKGLADLNCWIETQEASGGVPIVWSSGEQWLQNQSSKMRDRVKYNARRMAKAGFAVKTWNREEPCAHIIDILVAQKRPWLAARNLSSMIDEPAGVAFLQAAVAHSASRGELNLSVVHDAGRIAAVDLAFISGGVIYSYIASFDAEFHKYSFGRVLTDTLLMRACDDGMRRFDLLLGAYDYKTEYNCTLEPVRTQVLARGLLGRAAVAYYRRKAPPSAPAT